MWVMNTDGTSRTQLTQDGWRPVWASDGGRLFATHQDSEGWPYGLVVVDVDGWVLAEITPGVCSARSGFPTAEGLPTRPTTCS